MGFRFQRRVKLLPGITMNLGQSGSSFSFGPRGAKITVGKNGIRKTFGIPGTGLSYTTYDKYGGHTLPASAHPQQNIAPDDYSKLDFGFFSRLFMSNDDIIFASGLKAFISGNVQEAMDQLKKIYHIADAAFTAAMIALNTNNIAEAQLALSHAEKAALDLSKFYDKYQLALMMTLSVTEFLSVEIRPSLWAVHLAQVEVCQQKHEIAKACSILTELYKNDKDNIIVKISLAELILENAPNDKAWLQALVKMTDNISNDTSLHTVLLYYRAVVLKKLNLLNAALDSLTKALRKKSQREPDLLLALQEQRAEVYELSGNNAKAKKEWENIYIKNPGHPIALKKLNLK